MMGATKLVVVEDQVVTLEDIFGDLPRRDNKQAWPPLVLLRGRKSS